MIQNGKSSDEELLKEFNIKPCVINLDKADFSKIRIACSAVSNEVGVELSCRLVQEDTNTFSIQIKRKNNDDFSGTNQPKRPKLSNVMLKGIEIRFFIFIYRLL